MRITSVVILIALLTIPSIFAQDYSSSDLFLTVYVDGTVDLEYGVDLDPTKARINIALFGVNYNDLIIVNQDGDIVDYAVKGATVDVDCLGSTSVVITYNTPDLTTKIGSLWTINITSPATTGVLLPLGATIISLSVVPLEMGTIDGKPWVSLPEGELSVSYILGIVGSKDRAQALIRDAEATVASIKAKNIDVSSAEALIVQARSAFNLEDYLRAEQLATQAKSSALKIENQAQQDRNNLIIYAGAGGGIIIVGAITYFVLRKRRVTEVKGQTQKVHVEVTRGKINLESVFSKNPELRIDDKEVLRFLAEAGGEVFANEIRDRFDMPRTSAWRMIRRLVNMGIVEERKVGGQSLIMVTKKYRSSEQ